jgi:hypothetical protein
MRLGDAAGTPSTVSDIERKGQSDVEPGTGSYKGFKAVSFSEITRRSFGLNYLAGVPLSTPEQPVSRPTRALSLASIRGSQ